MKTLSIISLGHACSILQAMPTAVEQAAAALKVRPAAKINMVPHYAERDVERIGQYLRKRGGQ
jgi:hypothetical protein